MKRIFPTVKSLDEWGEHQGASKEVKETSSARITNLAKASPLLYKSPCPDWKLKWMARPQTSLLP